MSKFTVIGVLFVALAAFAFSTSARTAAAAGPPAGVSVSATSAGCGGTITATAFVVDTQGLPAIGVTVSFSTSGGGVGTGVTSAGGVATAVLSMPVTYTGAIQVRAQAGTAIGTSVVNVNCGTGLCGYGYNCVNPVCPVYGCVTAPYTPYCTYQAVYIGYNANCVTAPVVPVTPVYTGYAGCYYYNCANNYNIQSCYVSCYGSAPGKINIAVNPSSLTCGGSTNVSANITDGYGVPVPNGTAVSFTTSLGTIQNSGVTGGGNAVATLSTSAGTSGVALITVKAGNASGTTTVQVNCVQQAVQNVVVYKPGAGQIAQPGPQVIYRPEQGRPQGRPQNAPAGVPAFGPPRTGSAGLLDASEPEDAANATQNAAFDDQTNANVDTMMSDLPAALIDGNQLGDMSASASLALQVAPFLGGSAE